MRWQNRDATVSLALTPKDQEDIRWYLEDYLLNAYSPEQTIAAAIEQRMHDIGGALFRATFQGSEDARDLWATLRAGIADARIEISTTVQDAAALPWELLRDPRTGQALALDAAEFVRVQSQTHTLGRVDNCRQRRNFPQPSFPRKRESTRLLRLTCVNVEWIPAFAGMTRWGAVDIAQIVHTP